METEIEEEKEGEEETELKQGGEEIPGQHEWLGEGLLGVFWRLGR